MKLRNALTTFLSGGFILLILNIYGAETNVLQFVNPDLQLGAITNGQNFSVNFVLTNSSDQFVKIIAVDSSCHCTTVAKFPEQITAHGSGVFEFTFNSSRSSGLVTQNVFVETTDGQLVTGQFSASVETTDDRSNIPVPWLPDLGNGTYQNPVLFGDYPDLDAVRAGDDFYLVSSSFQVAPGLPILHSKDLVNWTIINHVFDAQPPAQHFSVPRHGEGVLAPAIRYHDGKFWVFYSDPDFGIYFLTATNAADRWTPPFLIKAGKGLIDPCPFWDDDGQLYLIHAWAKSRAGIGKLLTLHKLSAAATKVLDAGKTIIDGGKIPNWTTLEAPKLYKRKGYYYVFASPGVASADNPAMFRSKNIYGPYEPRIVPHQDRTPIHGAPQGAWVDTPSGENWFLHFQDLGVYGRVVQLEPMVWRDDDWPVIGSDPTGTGHGEPVLVHAKPSVGGTFLITAPQTSDDFAAETLGLQWQWNANPRPDWMTLTARRGFLRLASVQALATRINGASATKNIYDAPNLLLQKFPAREFTATTKLEFSPAADGERAGLVVFGFDYAFIGLRQAAGALRLVFDVNRGANRPGEMEREVASLDVKTASVWLRVSVGDGAVCHFSYSLDNQTFAPIGEPFIASGDRMSGAKVGLIATAAPGAAKIGHADFGWFHVSPPVTAMDKSPWQ